MSEEKSVEPMSQILSAEDLAYFREAAEESEAEKGWPKEKKAALAMEDVMLILKSHEAVEFKAKEAEAALAVETALRLGLKDDLAAALEKLEWMKVALAKEWIFEDHMRVDVVTTQCSGCDAISEPNDPVVPHKAHCLLSASPSSARARYIEAGMALSEAVAGWQDLGQDGDDLDAVVREKKAHEALAAFRSAKEALAAEGGA